MDYIKRYGYAVVGTGNLVLDTTKQAFQRTVSFVTETGRKDTTKAYQGLVERGEKIVGSIQRSVPVKRAGEQTKVARTQLKSAVTSVKKALGAQTEAVKASAKKVS